MADLEEEAFRNALKNAKIPVLVLDQKWHRLFAVSGKPDDITELEEKERKLLERQGKLNTDLKALKKVKQDLMKNIVSNISDDSSHAVANDEKKMSDDRRLIDESNQKIDEIEDELLDIPKQLDAANKELMMRTMAFCYEKLRTNESEAKEISDWISRFRVELKKNIIRKQNRVINNREIYSYMHDIFGKDVINLFDVRFEDYEETGGKEKDEKEKAEKEPADKTQTPDGMHDRKNAGGQDSGKADKS